MKSSVDYQEIATRKYLSVKDHGVNLERFLIKLNIETCCKMLPNICRPIRYS